MAHKIVGLASAGLLGLVCITATATSVSVRSTAQFSIPPVLSLSVWADPTAVRWAADRVVVKLVPSPTPQGHADEAPPLRLQVAANVAWVLKVYVLRASPEGTAVVLKVEGTGLVPVGREGGVVARGQPGKQEVRLLSLSDVSVELLFVLERSSP